jgi:hypothetical protein
MTAHLADDLLRALAALQLAQTRWLTDLDQACHGDHAFTASFRRWEEELTVVKLNLHRGENRLQHFLLAPREDAEPRHNRQSVVDGRAIARQWRRQLEDWFARNHLASAYRRLGSVLDLDEEASTGDIITDLATLAEVVAITTPALQEIAATRDVALLEDRAYFGVIIPWNTLGRPALHDVLRWLSDTLAEEADL